MNEFNTRLR